VNRIKVIGEIVEANVAMILKQGSLLLGWAYVTKRATMLGHTKVTAHQVALSLWLLFALVLDGV
jgi:Na+-driven multidrug efflux pump